MFCSFGQDGHKAHAHYGFRFGFAWACEAHAKQYAGTALIKAVR